MGRRVLTSFVLGRQGSPPPSGRIPPQVSRQATAPEHPRGRASPCNARDRSLGAGLQVLADRDGAQAATQQWEYLHFAVGQSGQIEGSGCRVGKEILEKFGVHPRAGC